MACRIESGRGLAGHVTREGRNNWINVNTTRRQRRQTETDRQTERRRDRVWKRWESACVWFVVVQWSVLLR